MMHTATIAAETYRRTEIQSRSPLELVVMLYDGAARSVSQARSAIERHDGPGKRHAIAKTLAIVTELQNVLDLEAGGEIAVALDSLYSFVSERLVEANQRDDVGALDDVAKVLAPLRDAWTELASSPPAGVGR